jgi:hypothetical protein
MSALEEEVACYNDVAHLRAWHGGVATGGAQRPSSAWPITVVWDAESAGASGQRPAGRGSGAGWPDPAAVPVPLAEGRGGAGVVSAAGRLPSARRSRRCSSATNILAADGSMRYA